jgi:hypothetical protein
VCSSDLILALNKERLLTAEEQQEIYRLSGGFK